ncbi:MAG: hypothetical protein HYT72_02325 [Candidatus Aenigmarchaeota archaeon]|nr:hypothetical protein [Candidatus Aenigmarchaeota archaeon]
MSSKRKIGKVVAGILFTLFLSAFILLFSFAQITDYSKLKPYVVDLSAKQLTVQKEQLMLFISQNCQNSKTAEIKLGDEVVAVSCQSNDFIGEIADKRFNNLYFRNYSCSLLECIKTPQTALAVVSLQANKLYSGYLILFAVLTVISTAFLVYFLRGWGIPKGVGLSMVSVGISYFIIGFAKATIPQEILSLAGPLVSLIIDTIAYNFLLVLVPGVILAVIGIAGSRLSKKK